MFINRELLKSITDYLYMAYNEASKKKKISVKRKTSIINYLNYLKISVGEFVK